MQSSNQKLLRPAATGAFLGRAMRGDFKQMLPGALSLGSQYECEVTPRRVGYAQCQMVVLDHVGDSQVHQRGGDRPSSTTTASYSE